MTEILCIPIKGIKGIYYRISKSLTDIYYGRVKHPWGMNIEDRDIEKEEAEKVFEYKSSLEKHFHT